MPFLGLFVDLISLFPRFAARFALPTDESVEPPAMGQQEQIHPQHDDGDINNKQKKKQTPASTKVAAQTRSSKKDGRMRWMCTMFIYIYIHGDGGWLLVQLET